MRLIRIRFFIIIEIFIHIFTEAYFYTKLKPSMGQIIYFKKDHEKLSPKINKYFWYYLLLSKSYQ
jgi:hypothetical protein